MRAFWQTATLALHQFWAVIGLASLAGLLVAGCGSSQPTRGSGHATSVASPTSAAAPVTTSTSTAGLPAIGALPPAIIPRGWTTYSNTVYHYSLQYPGNWLTPYGVSATQDSIYIYNYDPSQLHVAQGGIEPPPPLLVIGIFVAPNPSQQSPADFFVANQKGQGPPASSQVTHAVTVAGHPALEAIQNPVQWQYGGQSHSWAYPMIAYYIADGAYMLILAQYTAVDGQPADAFAHTIATLVIAE